MTPTLRGKLSCWHDAGERVAAVSVVETAGSSPRATGLALLVNGRGEIAGAVSGGCVDGIIVEACDEVLRTGASQSLFFAADQAGQSEWGDIGLICGGSLRVWVYELDTPTIQALIQNDGLFVLILRGPLEKGPTSLRVEPLPEARDIQRVHFQEYAPPEWEFREVFGQKPLLLIIGQSGFTPSLAALGRLLGHEVILCEPRARFASALDEADSVVQESPEACIEQFERQGRLDADAAILVCTHDRKFDLPALLAALRSGAGFIGAMGSRQTVADRRERLLASGLSEQEMRRIHSPLGLDLRAETPGETAVSVFAQWITQRRGGSGLPLDGLEGSIHGRS